jgi:hypothetical protein
MSQSQVIQAAESFTDWSAPWRFLEAVLTHTNLSETDRIMARNVWAHACGAALWQERDVSAGIVAAEQALNVAFPWLSPIAREHFVRAASYEWR